LEGGVRGNGEEKRKIDLKSTNKIAMDWLAEYYLPSKLEKKDYILNFFFIRYILYFFIHYLFYHYINSGKT
jgi:hypothetical protein